MSSPGYENRRRNNPNSWFSSEDERTAAETEKLQRQEQWKHELNEQVRLKQQRMARDLHMASEGVSERVREREEQRRAAKQFWDSQHSDESAYNRQKDFEVNALRNKDGSAMRDLLGQMDSPPKQPGSQPRRPFMSALKEMMNGGDAPRHSPRVQVSPPKALWSQSPRDSQSAKTPIAIPTNPVKVPTGRSPRNPVASNPVLLSSQSPSPLNKSSNKSPTHVRRGSSSALSLEAIESFLAKERAEIQTVLQQHKDDVKAAVRDAAREALQEHLQHVSPPRGRRAPVPVRERPLNDNAERQRNVRGRGGGGERRRKTKFVEEREAAAAAIAERRKRGEMARAAAAAQRRERVEANGLHRTREIGRYRSEGEQRSAHANRANPDTMNRVVSAAAVAADEHLSALLDEKLQRLDQALASEDAILNQLQQTRVHRWKRRPGAPAQQLDV